jgi:hypothetical protein
MSRNSSKRGEIDMEIYVPSGVVESILAVKEYDREDALILTDGKHAVKIEPYTYGVAPIYRLGLKFVEEVYD